MNTAREVAHALALKWGWACVPGTDTHSNGGCNWMTAAIESRDREHASEVERLKTLYAAAQEHLADWDRRVGELQNELAKVDDELGKYVVESHAINTARLKAEARAEAAERERDREKASRQGAEQNMAELYDRAIAAERDLREERSRANDCAEVIIALRRQLRTARQSAAPRLGALRDPIPGLVDIVAERLLIDRIESLGVVVVAGLGAEDYGELSSMAELFKVSCGQMARKLIEGAIMFKRAQRARPHNGREAGKRDE